MRLMIVTEPRDIDDSFGYVDHTIPSHQRQDVSGEWASEEGLGLCEPYDKIPTNALRRECYRRKLRVIKSGPMANATKRGYIALLREDDAEKRTKSAGAIMFDGRSTKSSTTGPSAVTTISPSSTACSLPTQQREDASALPLPLPRPTPSVTMHERPARLPSHGILTGEVPYDFPTLASASPTALDNQATIPAPPTRPAFDQHDHDLSSPTRQLQTQPPSVASVQEQSTSHQRPPRLPMTKPPPASTDDASETLAAPSSFNLALPAMESCGTFQSAAGTPGNDPSEDEAKRSHQPCQRADLVAETLTSDTQESRTSPQPKRTEKMVQVVSPPSFPRSPVPSDCVGKIIYVVSPLSSPAARSPEIVASTKRRRDDFPRLAVLLEEEASDGVLDDRMDLGEAANVYFSKRSIRRKFNGVGGLALAVNSKDTDHAVSSGAVPPDAAAAAGGLLTTSLAKVDVPNRSGIQRWEILYSRLTTVTTHLKSLDDTATGGYEGFRPESDPSSSSSPKKNGTTSSQLHGDSTPHHVKLGAIGSHMEREIFLSMKSTLLSELATCVTRVD